MTVSSTGPTILSSITGYTGTGNALVKPVIQGNNLFCGNSGAATGTISIFKRF